MESCCHAFVSQKALGYLLWLSHQLQAVSFSSARTTKRFPSSRCASAIHIVRPSQSSAEIPAPITSGFAKIVGDDFPVLSLETRTGRIICGRDGSFPKKIEASLQIDIAPLFLMGTLSLGLLRVHADVFVSDQCH
jgi:hypothetical protein